jgi:Fe(3+) dicitrate transport protein
VFTMEFINRKPVIATPMGVLTVLAGFCLAATPCLGAESNSPAATNPPPIRLPAVIVTGVSLATNVPVVPLNNVGSRNVFGPEQVRETGAREINDLVLQIPAISARPYNGGEASAPSFSMRGLPDDGLTEYINVLIDGVPASSMPYGWTAFSFLPVTPDRLYAVDYYRGAHSVRYSPNTVGGVLNFVTLPIPQSPSALFRGTFGDYGYHSLMLSSGGTFDRTGVGATYGYRSGDGYRDNGGFTQHDANVKGRYLLDEQSWVGLSLSYMHDEHQAPGGLTQAQFDANRFGNARPENRFDGDRLVTDAVYHRDLESGGSAEGFAYFSDTERHLRAQRPHFGVPATMSDWQDTSYFVGTGVRLAKPVEMLGMEHNLYGGLRYQREWLPHYRLTSEPYPGGPQTLVQDQNFSLDTVSLHLDDTFRPFERLTVNAGVRLEWVPNVAGRDRVAGWGYSDQYFTALPGAGASYELAKHWALFGNYFHGFRAPQVWGYGSAAGAGHGLVFEQGRSAELGLRLEELAGFGGSVTLWRNEYDNFGVYYDGTYNNLGKIEAKGLDFDLEWKLGGAWEALEGFSVGGSFTLQNSKLRSGPFSGNDVPYAWEQKAAWRMRYERRGWTATLGGTYVGESFSDEPNTVAASADGRLGVNPSRVIWDARLAKRFGLSKKLDLELATGASNLFGHDWYVHSRGGFFGPGLAAGPPRQVYGSIELKYNF